MCERYPQIPEIILRVQESAPLCVKRAPAIDSLAPPGLGNADNMRLAKLRLNGEQQSLTDVRPVFDIGHGPPDVASLASEYF
ncbi:MAG: hypothetical protein HHJ12_06475 [Glaciimonas sp.]|nr:hypothetical protein [Glaciimonas sp.]